jgi:hypothetical protein
MGFSLSGFRHTWTKDKVKSDRLKPVLLERYYSGQRNGQRFTYVLHQVSIQQVRLPVKIGQTHRAKDDSNTWGFTGAPRAIGLRHGCCQRLESPGTERRRALPLLPPGPSDPGALSGGAVSVPVEACSFLAVAAGRGPGHGPCFFADLASRASLRLVSSLKRFL